MSTDKRLQKRHKRQVSRARQRVRVSRPDVRTPEQLRAAREASRPSYSDMPSHMVRPEAQWS
jgi:hypothetical protein